VNNQIITDKRLIKLCEDKIYKYYVEVVSAPTAAREITNILSYAVKPNSLAGDVSRYLRTFKWKRSLIKDTKHPLAALIVAAFQIVDHWSDFRNKQVRRLTDEQANILYSAIASWICVHFGPRRTKRTISLN